MKSKREIGDILNNDYFEKLLEEIEAEAKKNE
jgi:hypothetical protein